MKRTLLSAIICFCLAVSLMAQDGYKVNFKGSKPTVTDFTWAAFTSLNYEDEEETGDRPWTIVRDAMERQRNGLPLDRGETLTIDTKNGYILFEKVCDEYDDVYVIRMEVCYWNEKDGKHKLIGFNNMASVEKGKPFFTEVSDFVFFRYNNATKRMVRCDPPGFEIDYEASYELPREGKNIIATRWNSDGTTERTVLKWNGRRFTH